MKKQVVLEQIPFVLVKSYPLTWNQLPFLKVALFHTFFSITYLYFYNMN